jgi:hypothetical protein
MSLLIWRILIGLLAGSAESGARMQAESCWLRMQPIARPGIESLLECKLHSDEIE